MHERGAIGRAVVDFLASTDVEVRHVAAVIAPDVDPAVVDEVWATTTGGTLADGADLTLDRGQALLRCFDCGGDYPGDKTSPCPRCGGSGLIVRPVAAFEIVRWEAR